MSRRVRNTCISLLALTVVLSVFAGGGWWWANRQFNEIPTFSELGSPDPGTPAVPLTLPEPAPAGITTFAMFSIGSDGVDVDEAERLRIGEDRLEMSDGLTDSIAIVSVDPAHSAVSVLSIPRDLWRPDRGDRINTVYNSDGAAGLIDELTELTGIEIHHAVAVNFTAVADIVDTLGGIWARTEVPARDLASGLHLSGDCTQLDGADALAWSRARHLETADGTGNWDRDHTGDLGRMERQQQLIGAVIAQHGWWGIATALPSLLNVAEENIVRDDSLTLSKVTSIANALRSGATIAATTPEVTPTRRGSASVVELTDAGSVAIEALAAQIRAQDLAAPAPESGGATSSSTTAPGSSSTTTAPGSTTTTAAPTGTGADEGDGPKYSAVTLTACTPER